MEQFSIEARKGGQLILLTQQTKAIDGQGRADELIEDYFPKRRPYFRAVSIVSDSMKRFRTFVGFSSKKHYTFIEEVQIHFYEPLLSRNSL